MAVATHPPIQPSPEPAHTIRTRLKADLIVAMKARQTDTIMIIRTLLAAIDNEEAVPRTSAPTTSDGYTPDVPRRVLRATDIHAILTREADECRQAATDYARLGQHDAADRMHTALALIQAYRLSLESTATMPAHGVVEMPQ